MNENNGFLEKETTLDQLWTRESFLWKIRWAVILWLFAWSFLPQQSEIPQPAGFLLLAAAAIYNLALSVAVSTRYKTALSAFSFTADSFIITAAVYFTGGMASELWPLYFLLIISSSMVINFRSEFALLAFVAFLYATAAASDIVSPAYASLFLNRIFILAAVVFAAYFVAGIERSVRRKAESMAKDSASLYEKTSRFSSELEGRIDTEMTELKKKYRQQEILFRISSALTSDIELDKILAAVIKGVQEGLGFDRVGIFEVSDGRSEIKGRLGVDRWGKPENIESQVYSMDPEDNNLAKIAAGKLESFFTEDADSVLPESQKKYMVSGVGQNAVVPMKFRDAVIGMIAVDNVITKKPITSEDLHLLRAFADQAATAVHNARMFGRERETAVRLKRLEEARDIFLSKMSHELKTPLAVIKEAISVIQHKITGETTPTQEKFLGIAMDNADRLAGMLAEILDLSKMEARQLKLEISSVNLAELADQVIYDLKPLAESKDISVRSDIFRETAPVHADKGKLFRLLTNLVVNAIKYTRPGGHIVVSCSEGERDITIAVSDDGDGIEPSELQKVFEKFYQADRAPDEPRDGVGLGLTIAKEITEAHGGSIRAESEGKGRGSRFSFTLPKG